MKNPKNISIPSKYNKSEEGVWLNFDEDGWYNIYFDWGRGGEGFMRVSEYLNLHNAVRRYRGEPELTEEEMLMDMFECTFSKLEEE